MRCIKSATCCLLYCMAITEPLRPLTPPWRTYQAGGGPQKWMASCDYSEFEPNRYYRAEGPLAKSAPLPTMLGQGARGQRLSGPTE